MSNRRCRIFAFLVCAVLQLSCHAQSVRPPGHTVKHLPAVDRAYLGSPSICKLSNGEYLVSCDIFGKDTKENRTLIFRSKDKGNTWDEMVEIEQFWSTLFAIRDTVYLLGTRHANGDVVIRRSTDCGKTWTSLDEETGVVLKGKYHTAPTNIVIKDNKVYKAFEDANRDEKWPSLYGSFLLYADLDSDLLDKKSWTSSNVLFRDGLHFQHDIQGWLEGNVVVDKNDRLHIMMRVHSLSKEQEFAIKIPINDHTLDKSGVHVFEFPGGSKKFDMKYDQVSGKYWSLVNYVPEKFRGIKQLDRIRNTVYLVSSEDLLDWKLEKEILSHPDIEKHGFQYLSFLIEGDDIIAVCRTAHDDAGGGASDYHNSNFITFHRISNFRQQ